MFCEKLKSTPGNFVFERAVHFVGQLVLIDSSRPFAEWLERNVELGVEEPGCVGAVVGTAVLRHHRDRFGITLDDAAHLVDVVIGLFQRDRGRHRGANPEIAFLQVRQELESEGTRHQDRDREQHQHAAERQQPIGEREFHDRLVQPPQHAHDNRLGLFEFTRQEERAERRRDRERREQAAGDRIGIGPRHGTEDVAFDARQREQRHEGGHDDRRGKEDRLAHFLARDEDRTELAVKSGARRTRTPVSAVRPVGDGSGKMAIDVLHHDDGRIDDKAEIDRTHRQEVCGLTANDENGDGEQECEGDGRGDDQCASEIAQEDPLHQEYENDADGHVLKHGAGGDADEFRAVVDRFDVHAGGQDSRAVDLGDFGFDGADRRHALLAAVHEDDSLHDVVVVVLPRDAEPRFVADGNARHVAQQHGRSVVRSENRVADVVHGPDEAKSANDRRLRPDVQGLAADIDIGVVERLQHLWKREPVAQEFVLVDGDVVGFRLPAPTGHVDHAGHCLEAAFENPVLDRLQIGDRITRRTLEPIPVDLSDRTLRRNLRLRPVGKLRQLGQPVGDPLLGLVIGEIVGELNLDVGKTEQGDGADRRDVGNSCHLNFDGHGDVAFDLLGGLSLALGDDFDQGRNGVWIRLDVQFEKADDARAKEQQQENHDKNSLPESESDDRTHGAPIRFR